MPKKIAQSCRSILVLDGQHRLEAAKNLGIPVYYRLTDSENNSELIRVVNAFSRNWKDTDYLNHFVALKKKSYIQLADFIQRHNIGLGSALGLLQGGSEITRPVGVRMLFRTGAFEIDEGVLAVAEAAMQPVNEIRNFHERIKHLRRDESFIKAIMVMTSSRHYEHDRFMKNMLSCLTNIVYCTRVADYLKILEEVYNFRRHDNKRMVISRRGMTPVNQEAEAE